MFYGFKVHEDDDKLYWYMFLAMNGIWWKFATQRRCLSAILTSNTNLLLSCSNISLSFLLQL